MADLVSEVSSSEPIVSVVLPVYNGKSYLRESIESVLAQTLVDLELIVVDDGSTDESGEVAACFEDERLVLLRHEENLGLVAALNTGIEAARGRYVAIQNADDVSLPDRLELQAALLDADPGLVVVGSAWEVVDESGSRLGTKTRPVDDTGIRWMALFLTPFGHPTVMVRAATLRDYGLSYEHDFYLAEDFRLWSLLLRHGRGANLTHSLVRYRTHAAQLSSSTWDEQSTMAERVSRANLEFLGIQLDLESVRRLRALALHPPRRFDRVDFDLVRPLLSAIAALERSHPGSYGREARRMLGDAVLGSVLRGAYAGVWTSGALTALARVEPGWLGTAPLRWLTGRFRDNSWRHPGRPEQLERL